MLLGIIFCLESLVAGLNRRIGIRSAQSSKTAPLIETVLDKPSGDHTNTYFFPECHSMQVYTRHGVA
jgi:hypothetical protein